MAGAQPQGLTPEQMIRREVDEMSAQDLQASLRAARDRLFNSEAVPLPARKQFEQGFKKTGMGKLCDSDAANWSDDQKKSAQDALAEIRYMDQALEKASQQKFGKTVDFRASEGLITPIGSQHNEMIGKLLDSNFSGALGSLIKLGAALAVIFGLGKTMGDHSEAIQKAVDAYNADLKKQDPKAEQYTLQRQGSGFQVLDSHGQLASASVTSSIANRARDFSQDQGYTATTSQGFRGFTSPTQISASPKPADDTLQASLGTPTAPAGDALQATVGASSPVEAPVVGATQPVANHGRAVGSQHPAASSGLGSTPEVPGL